MRPAFEEADIHPLELERRDEVEYSVVREQRKCKVGTGQLGFHDGTWNAVGPWVSHSAAVK